MIETHPMEATLGPELDAMSPMEMADLLPDPFRRLLLRRTGPVGMVREELLTALYRRLLPTPSRPNHGNPA